MSFNCSYLTMNVYTIVGIISNVYIIRFHKGHTFLKIFFSECDFVIYGIVHNITINVKYVSIVSGCIGSATSRRGLSTDPLITPLLLFSKPMITL